MSIEDAWKLYLEPGGKSVENRNRIVEMLYGPLVERLTETLNERYVEAMKSEAGVVLVREVDNATNEISVTDLMTLIRKRPLGDIDFQNQRIERLVTKGRIEFSDNWYTDREREAWKTGPDSAVDDPTIRFRPYSASLIAAEKHAEASRAEGFLVRESIE